MNSGCDLFPGVVIVTLPKYAVNCTFGEKPGDEYEQKFQKFTHTLSNDTITWTQ